jgi:hypothetical protein
VKSCTDYMGLIDGSVDFAEPTPGDLEDHLQACKACTDYRTGALVTKRLLKEFRATLSSPDATVLALKNAEYRITSLRRQFGWSLVLVVACISAPFGAMVVGSPLPLGGVLSFLAVGLVSLVVPWQLLRKQSALTAVARREGSFYQTWRQELQRELRGTTAGAVFASLFSAVFLFLAAFASFPFPGNFVVFGVALLMGVGALHAFTVELRALRNELALVRTAGGE